MTIQNLSLDKSTEVDLIEKIIYHSLPVVDVKNILPEIEFRLGYYQSNYGKTSYKTGVRKELFENVKNSILYDNKFISSSIDITDTIYYKGLYRKIVSSEGITYQHKIKYGKSQNDPFETIINLVTDVTLDQYNQYSNEITALKLAKAYEIPLNESVYNKSVERESSMTRTRSTFVFKNFKIDMTERKLERYTQYEIEGEFNNDFVKQILSDRKNIPLFITEIRYALSTIFTKIHSIGSEKMFLPLLSNITSLFKNLPRELQPINIQKSDIETGMHNYAVTNKLDGVGYYFTFIKQIINNVPVYNAIICNKKDIWKLAIIREDKLTKKDITILNSISKCEVRILNDKTEIHFFDCLYSETKTMKTNVLKERILFCEEIKNYCISNIKIDTISFHVKPFFQTNIYEDIYNVVNYMNEKFGINAVDVNDGIIFQPIGDTEDRRAIKWKFYSKITIDFLLQNKKVSGNQISYELHSQFKKGMFRQFENHTILFKKDEVFDGKRVEDLEGYVLETSIINNVSIPHRIRFDKTKFNTNYEKVAIDTYYDMVNELTLPDLIKQIKSVRGESKEGPRVIQEVPEISKEEPKVIQEKETLDEFRKTFNLYKSNWISKYCNNKTVLDLGSGKGGDLFKYIHNNVKKLYLVEPSSSNLKEMNDRLSNIKNNSINYSILQAKGEETQKITEFVKEKVDIVSMMFSLTFFFKDRDTLLSLINTIDSNLKVGGTFIVGVMDGKEVEDYFNEHGELDNELVVLKKIDVKPLRIFGQEVFIDCKNTQTATSQNEWLVNIDELTHLLEYKQIYLKEQFYPYKEIMDKNNLNETEKILSKFYKFYSFEKTNIGSEQTKFANYMSRIPIKGNENVLDEYWYRIPSPGDGSCLFHSILMNLLGDEYNYDLAKDFRINIAENFEISEYLRIQDGQFALINFQNTLFEVENKRIYNCFKKLPNVTEVSIIDRIDKIMSEHSSSIKNVKDCIKIIIIELTKQGFDPVEVKDFCKGLLIRDYLKVSSELKDCGKWSEFWVLIYLMDLLKINIVIIHTSNMKEMKLGKEYDKNRLFIVVLNINNSHYEPIVKKEHPTFPKYLSTFTYDEIKNIIE